jgi:hypothetical protein
MLGRSDHDNMAIFGGRTGGKFLDSGDERTGGIHDLAGVLLKLALDARCDAMGPDDSRFIAADLDGLADSGYALMSETLHFLFIMDQRAERPNLVAGPNGRLDHFDGTLDPETKSVFIRQ